METDSGVIKTDEEADRQTSPPATQLEPSTSNQEQSKLQEDTDLVAEKTTTGTLSQSEATASGKVQTSEIKSDKQTVSKKKSKRSSKKSKKKKRRGKKKKKKSKKKFRESLDRYYETPEPPLIIKLLDPSYIVEDVGDNLRVVLFVENDKPVLKKKDVGEGKARIELIKSLKKQRNNPDMDDVNFYFTSCKFIKHLCDELSISKISNQVVYLTNYTITPIRMDYLDIQEELFNRLFNGLRGFKNVEYLNQFIETTNHSNVVLFNFDKPPTAEELKAKKKKGQLGRAVKIIRECRRNCFNYMNYVYLEEPDEFLKQKEKRNKVTIKGNHTNMY